MGTWIIVSPPLIILKEGSEDPGEVRASPGSSDSKNWASLQVPNEPYSLSPFGKTKRRYVDVVDLPNIDFASSSGDGRDISYLILIL